MYQVAAPIWNQIAKSGKVQNPVLKSLMSLDQEKLTAELETQADILESKGYSDSVILAYQTVAPLFLERHAIQSWMADNERVELMRALPEVVSIDEAVALMTLEYRLGEMEADPLRQLLELTLKS